MNKADWIIPTWLDRRVSEANMRAWYTGPEPRFSQRSNREVEFRLLNGLPAVDERGDRWYPHEYFLDDNIEYAYADDDLSIPCTWMEHDDDPGDCGFDSQFPTEKLNTPGRVLWRFTNGEQHFPVTAPAKQ